MSIGWAPHAFFTRIEDNRCSSKDVVDSKATTAVVDLEGGGKTYI